MGFWKSLFGGSSDAEESNYNKSERTSAEHETASKVEKEDKPKPSEIFSAEDCGTWKKFFGLDLTAAPNADWFEGESEYNIEGDLIRNFELYDLPDSYFTSISAKVIGTSATNFFFKCPFSREDVLDIFFIIERDLVHNGNYHYDQALRDFRKKNFEGLYDSIDWEFEEGNIMMSRDMDSGDLELKVWSNFYNEEFLGTEVDTPLNSENVSEDTQNEEYEVEDEGENKIFTVTLPSGLETLEFLKENIEMQMQGQTNLYVARIEDGIVRLFDPETFDEEFSFSDNAIKNYVGERLAVIGIKDTNLDDLYNPEVDFLVRLVEPAEEDNGEPRIYYEMSYLVDKVNYDLHSKIIMDGNMTLNLVGMQHRDNYEQLQARIHEGLSIVLKPEPDNEFDPNALAFYLSDGTLLGYLPKKDQPFARIFMAQGQIEVIIVSADFERGWVDTEVKLSRKLIDFNAFDPNISIWKITTEKGIGRKQEKITFNDLVETIKQ